MKDKIRAILDNPSHSLHDELWQMGSSATGSSHQGAKWSTSGTHLCLLPSDCTTAAPITDLIIFYIILVYAVIVFIILLSHTLEFADSAATNHTTKALFRLQANHICFSNQIFKTRLSELFFAGDQIGFVYTDITNLFAFQRRSMRNGDPDPERLHL